MPKNRPPPQLFSAPARLRRLHRSFRVPANAPGDLLCSGHTPTGVKRIEHIERRRTDAVYLDALGAQRVPDPTTAGDFCHRFSEDGVVTLMDAINQTRPSKGILAEMAQGHGVALLPVQAELTTQQAADLLKVSRPYLIRLLEDRRIPFRLVGQHRRVRFDDLLAYQRKDDEERRRVADELTADAQELGMGY